jgi:spermidine/putrescine-binding protein
MGKFFDPENEYSMPLYWDVMALGYSKKKFPNGLPSNSWAMVFEKDQVPCKTIGMIDDAREILALESKYLGLKKANINKYTIRKMKDMLIAQKKWAGVYCDAQQGYFLLSEAYPLVVSYREYVCREMIDYDFIDCMVPEEGSLLTIDNIVISKTTKKEDLVYEFLNYLYSHDVYLRNSEEFAILPSSKKVFEDLDQEYIGIKGLHPKMLREKNIRVFKNLLTLKQTNKFWIKVKSA